MLRQNLTSTLVIIIVALALPRLCCCLHISSSNEESTSTSSSHCCSSHSDALEAQTEGLSLSRAKLSCECEHYNSAQNFVLSKFEASTKVLNVWVNILSWPTIELVNERYEWLAYNQKRGPPDFFGRRAKLTYLINQSILI